MRPRVRRGVLRACLASAVVVVSLGLGVPGRATAGVHHVVRVGVVDFTPTPGDAKSLEGLLADTARASASTESGFKTPVDFEVLAGNYYQILSWAKTKKIDAAVVSPMVAYLLSREGSVPAFELAERDKGGAFHYAQVTLRTFSGGGWSAPSSNGAFVKFESTLCGLLLGPRPKDAPARRCASFSAAGSIEASDPNEVELEMVSHLSTSGFIAPLIFTRQWLVLQKQKGTTIPTNFWDRLMSRIVRFRFSHDVPHDGGSKKFELEFGYGDGGAAPGVEACQDEDSGCYPPKTKEQAPLQIPNDTFVIHRDVVPLLPALNPAPAVPPPWVGCDATGTLAPQVDSVRGFDMGCLRRRKTVEPADMHYMEARRISEGQQVFAKSIAEVFGFGLDEQGKLEPAEDLLDIRDSYHRWYEMEDFTFTIAESLDFLRKDQQVTDDRHLALVLPGGGVKATYQSVILDHMYGGGDLVNGIPLSGAPADDRTLHVESVIGTSGGALMGLFTSLLDKSDPSFGHSLTDHWVKANVVVASNTRVFPWLSVPRYLSLWLMLAVTALAFFVSNRRVDRRRIEPASGGVLGRAGGSGFVGWYPTVALMGLIFAVPLLLRWAIQRAGGNHSPELYEYQPLAEGLLYILIVVAAHYVWASGQRNGESARKGKIWIGWFAFGVLVMCGSVAFAQHCHALYTVPLTNWKVWPLSVALVGGATFAVIGMVIAGHRNKCGFRFASWQAHLAALAILAVVLLVAHTIVGVGVLFHYYTYLELDGDYWLAVVFAALVAALAAHFVRHHLRGRQDRGWRRRAFDGFEYLNKSEPFLAKFDSSPLWTLTFTTLFALILWLRIVTPSLYSNVKAIEFLKAEVAQSLPAKQVPSSGLDLKATLVVTTTNLKRVDDHEKLLPPEYYFCFGPSCPPELRRGVQSVFDSPVPFEKIIDPVFASGSPFPLFPGHSVKYDGEAELMPMIDGGYAHNTPVEAARQVGARQILIINSSSSETDPASLRRHAQERNSLKSQLYENLGLLPGFLFDRSQDTDRRAESAFVAVAITPADDGDAAPFLGDFRPNTILRMRDDAERDWKEGRVGSIVSVGVPPSPLFNSSERE